METLELHCSEGFDAEAGAFSGTLVPNLTLLFDGQPKYFETHDNGGRPFRVGITRNSVSIHANYNPLSNTGTYEWDEAPLLAHFDHCKRAFVGVSSGSCWCDHDTSFGGRFGNSILLCLEGGKSEVTIGLNPPKMSSRNRAGRVEMVDFAFFRRLLEGCGEVSAMCSEVPSPDKNRGIFAGSEQVFIFVGDCIYVFKLPDGDEVVEYYSMIGRSDVPYPVAVGKKFLYFMLDRGYVPREDINEEEWLHDPVEVDEDVDGPRWEDAYRWFYCEDQKGRMKPFPSCFELAHRL